MGNYTISDSSAPAQGRSVQGRLSLEILREITAHAKDLYDAICGGYRCECPFPHQASLRLRQVSPSHINVNEPFELFFSVDESTTTLISELDQKFSNSPKEQRGRSVLIRLISFGETEDDVMGGRLIDDLCTFAKNYCDDSPASSFYILAWREKKYILKTNSLSSFSLASQSVVCLDDFLPPYQTWELTKQKRTDLALSLSTTILVFYSTPWIDEWWTWKDFCMLKDDNKQVFVTGKFYSTQKPSSPTAKKLTHPAAASPFWSCYGEPMLTRLGFALIELALGKRLSQLKAADADPNADQNMVDTFTAKRVLADGSVFREAD